MPGACVLTLPDKSNLRPASTWFNPLTCKLVKYTLKVPWGYNFSIQVLPGKLLKGLAMFQCEACT